MTPEPNNVLVLDETRRVLFTVRKALKLLDVDELLSVAQHVARLRDQRQSEPQPTKPNREAGA